MAKSLTVRIDDDRAARLEAVAQADEMSLNGAVLDAIDAHIERRRQDPEFQGRLQRVMEQHRKTFELLAK